MKKRFSYLFMTAFFFAAAVSCIDETIREDSLLSRAPVLKLKIYLPGGDGRKTRASGSYQDQDNNPASPYPGNLDSETDMQRYIAGEAGHPDVMALEFEGEVGEGKLLHVVEDLTIEGDNGAGLRTLKGTLLKTDGKAYIAVLVNLKEQNININPTDFLDTCKGKSETEIYKDLVYRYPNDPKHPKTGWNLNDRKLPMWGRTKSFSTDRDIYTSCGLYRSLAKLGVQVDARCENFRLKEVYVYYINEKGYFAAPTKQPKADVHVQYEEPEIPYCGQRGKDNPLEYVVDDTAFLNQIYVPEADNTSDGSGEKAVKIVVGGVYTGEKPDNTAITYYCIDLQDDKGNAAGEKKPFDLVRNHSYIFNIISAKGPGELTPEKALPHLTVEIEEWPEVYMRGVPDQYTLRVNKSVINCENHKDLTPKTLTAWTDLKDGWTIEDVSDWFSVEPLTGDSATITVTPNSINYDLTREGSFYVVAGDIRKEIKVIMPQPETANCYIVGEGDHRMIVTIKGNGKNGVWAEGHVSLIPGKSNPSDDDISHFIKINPAKIGVIWETHPGLVRLYDPGTQELKNAGEGIELHADTSSIKYNVSADKAYIGGVKGGNALIGAFDKNDTLLWSWHIWVAPDLINSDGKVREEFIEKWSVNDYDVLDRNLGALSNRPIDNPSYVGGKNNPMGANSVASQGLLYQWGRKDPFIGANYSKTADYNGDTRGLLEVVHYYKSPRANPMGWGVMDVDFGKAEETILATIQNPTLLVKEAGPEPEKKYLKGMSSIPDCGEYLWGVSKALVSGTKDLGVKTIYDPSPVGFRVPPVDAFIFALYTSDRSDKVYRKGKPLPNNPLHLGKNDGISKKYGFPVFYEEIDKLGFGGRLMFSETGEISINFGEDKYFYVYEAIDVGTTRPHEIISSETKNWRLNLVYVPHFTKTDHEHHVLKPQASSTETYDSAPSDAYQWGNYYHYEKMQENDDRLIWIYAEDYIMDAPYYGFYMDYDGKADHFPHEPQLTDERLKGTKILWNGERKNIQFHYKLDPGEISTSWFPITGVYDPYDGVTLNQKMIQAGVSVTVNSFLWTNSTVYKKTGEVTPTALFLHGTEDQSKNGASGNIGSGRHFHALKDEEIEAEPQYAGAVRCVSEREKTVWRINSLIDSVTISHADDAITEISIISVNQKWKLVTAGAPWLEVVPDHGDPDKGLGQTIKLMMVTGEGIGLPDPGTATSLEFQIEGEPQPRTVTVTVKDS